MLYNIIMLIVIIIVLILFVVALYCRIQEYIDNKVKNAKYEKNNIKTKEKKGGKKNIVKKVYHFIYGYGYGLMRYTNICVGKIPSFRVRRLLYKQIFRMKITKKTVIYGGCEFRSPWNINMDNCVVAVGCIFDGRNGIKIANNVVFGGGVHIWTEEHDVNDPNFGISESGRQPVVIGERAWICSDSTILPGVNIAEGTVVASRACVTKDTEKFSVYGGVPARKISERNDKLMYELSGKCHFHFY